MNRLALALTFAIVLGTAAAADPNGNYPQPTGDNRLDDSAQATHVSKGNTGHVAPGTDPNASPDLDARSTVNPPMLPGPAVLSSQVSTFAVSPKTIRQGFVYHDGAKTEITLTQPAKRELTYEVVSSWPDRVECGKIVFEKGDIKRTGTVHVKWENVADDCSVSLKIFSSHNSTTVLYLRLYLHPQVASQ